MAKSHDTPMQDAFWAKATLNLISKAMGKRINNMNSADVADAFGMELE
jgi:hypothetical protein